jgi:SHS2 domain-containing protein
VLSSRGKSKQFGSPPYEEVEHTADWALRARGRTLDELFANAARGMMEMQQSKAQTGEVMERELVIEGADREGLLVNWLNELLYLQERGEAYSEFHVVEISPVRLKAQLRGRKQQKGNRSIKAVTFHGLELKEASGIWEATVVMDV